MPFSTLQVKSVGNAIITRYNNGEGATIAIIIANSYPALNDVGREDDRAAVVAYIGTKRPDIPVS